jgi:hypothetical protein
MALPKGADFLLIFERLRSILVRHVPPLIVKHDGPDTYYLDTAHIMKNGQPLFFGAVKLMKGQVSFYLMPIYLFPELLEQISPALRKRLKGKSCFHFTAMDESLLAELADLTTTGLARYAAAGYLAAEVTP